MVVSLKYCWYFRFARRYSTGFFFFFFLMRGDFSSCSLCLSCRYRRTASVVLLHEEEEEEEEEEEDSDGNSTPILRTGMLAVVTSAGLANWSSPVFWIEQLKFWVGSDRVLVWAVGVFFVRETLSLFTCQGAFEFSSFHFQLGVVPVYPGGWRRGWLLDFPKGLRCCLCLTCWRFSFSRRWFRLPTLGLLSLPFSHSGSKRCHCLPNLVPSSMSLLGFIEQCYLRSSRSFGIRHSFKA